MGSCCEKGQGSSKTVLPWSKYVLFENTCIQSTSVQSFKIIQKNNRSTKKKIIENPEEGGDNDNIVNNGNALSLKMYRGFYILNLHREG